MSYLIFKVLMMLAVCSVSYGQEMESSTDSMTKSTTAQMSSTTTTTTTTTTPTGYLCVFGTPDNLTPKRCPNGCFGRLLDEVAFVGCLADMSYNIYGLGDITTCGTDEKNGKCVYYDSGDGKKKNSMKCCNSEESCNEAFTKLDPYTKCGGAGAVRAAYFLLLPLAILCLFH